MKLFIGAKVKTKRGLDVKITAIPDADYVYGHVIPTGTFIIVRRAEITKIYNSEQGQLFV